MLSKHFMARLLLLIAIPCAVHGLISSTIKQKVSTGKRKFQCTFVLRHTNTVVSIKNSKVICMPKKPKRQTVNVELTSGNYFFVGTIKINPTSIISMNVETATTLLPTTITTSTTTTNTTTTNTTTEITTSPTSPSTKVPEPISGSEGGLEELYKNVSSDIMPEYRLQCGIDAIEENMQRMMNKSYTNMEDFQFWTDGVVPWSFVSNGDEFDQFAVHTDENVGLSKDDVETVMAAMKQIEAKTCIRFKQVTPVKGQPWLIIVRDSKYSDLSCQGSYILSNLVGKDINGLGDIYKRLGWGVGSGGGCFGGAYAWYGSDSPQMFVISRTRLFKTNQGAIGLVIHELLHNLGLGHTQKRQDASEHVQINWGNIEENKRHNYEACIEANNPRCSRYNDYGSEYECMSIMHYRDYFFRTQDALAKGGKTMVAKKAGCDLSSSNNILTNADVDILKRMYCANSPLLKVVKSTNYPENYLDNEDKQFPISVNKGHVVALTFSDFQIEDQLTCAYDWLQVLDGDGTVLLDYTCGFEKPDMIISKTNSVIIIFSSDSINNYKGFRAEYEAVKRPCNPVDGEWSDWSGFSACSNQKDGKSPCRKRKVRDCNEPPAQCGGADCVGDAEEYKDCNPATIDPPKNPNCMLLAGWTPWSDTSACSADCTSTRTRTCTNPLPVNSKECDGAKSESRECTGGDCPSSKSGTITSPNYPDNYANNQHVTIPIEVTPSSIIELSFTAFDVEFNPNNCVWDYVKVIDSDGTELAKLCGDSLPSPIISYGYKMTVVFHSDYIINKKGFEATWQEFAAAGDDCTFDENTDYPGLDLNLDTGMTTDLQSSAQECRELCNSNVECNAFTFQGQFGGHCWLKTGISSKNFQEGSISGLACRM